MSFLCNPLTLLHHERCIASSPHGDVCQESIDFTTRGFAHRELVLSEQESRSEARATNLRNAARLMICDNHKNRSQEARRIARLWGKQTAQQSNAILHSPASTEVPTYKQSPHSQISFEGGICASLNLNDVVLISSSKATCITGSPSSFTAKPQHCTGQETPDL